MAKKLTKQGSNFALTLEKKILDTLGINEKTNLEILVVGDSLLIKPRGSKTHKKKTKELEHSADQIMDKYEEVFKKLAKT